MVDKYEDPFVKISAMIGGDEYLKVSRSLLKSEDATDEEIASSTGLRINMVRKVLYDLFGKGLITGVRVKDERKGWFVYRWRSRHDEVENFIDVQKKKVLERLQQRYDYENGSDFYHCGNGDCPRAIYEKADFNISISNQPHSEISALAIVLDRLHKGKQFDMKFENSVRRIIPTKKGKKVILK